MAPIPKDKTRCGSCRRVIPKSGVGRISHLRRHVRAGDLVEVAGPHGPEFHPAGDPLAAAVALMKGRLARAAASVRG